MREYINKVALYKAVLTGRDKDTKEYFRMVYHCLADDILNVEYKPKNILVSSWYVEQITPFLWIASFCFHDVTNETPEEFSHYHCKPIEENKYETMCQICN